MARYGSGDEETVITEYLDSHLEGGIKQKNLDTVLDLIDEYIELIECAELYRRNEDMVTETNEYEGRQFICDSCGYVVSSNAMSDFDVDDFNYCPCCGEPNECADI